MTDKELPPNPERRKFLKIGSRAVAIAAVTGGLGIGVGGVIYSGINEIGNMQAQLAADKKHIALLQQELKDSQDALTPEQQEKIDAMHVLKDFMTKYTTSNIVTAFLADSSNKDINKCMTIGTQDLYGIDKRSTWELRIPDKNRNIDEEVPTIVYIPGYFNKGSDSHQSESVRLWIDRKGDVRKNMKHDDPNLSLSNFGQIGYDAFSEKEMKLAVGFFARQEEFYFDDDWQFSLQNSQGKLTQAAKRVPNWFEKSIFAAIDETGCLTFMVSPAPVERSINTVPIEA